MFPETSGRTLEELAFSKLRFIRMKVTYTHIFFSLYPVFEGKDVQKRQAKETEQELINGHIAPPMELHHRSGDVGVGDEPQGLQRVDSKKEKV